MSKFWKLTYKEYYGSRGNYWNKTVSFYDEEKFLREVKKLKDCDGFVEEYELTTKSTLSNYLSSLLRDVQLDNVLVVTDEKSILYSKFVELIESVQVVESKAENRWTNEILYDKSFKMKVINEWEFLTKSDDSAVKKFFAKYRTFFLNYSHDTLEWYETLLSIYNYANITPHTESRWEYNKTERKYDTKKIVLKELTDNQKTNYFLAKNNLKKIKLEEKKKLKTKKDEISN
jgi:hypothetical protein